MGSYTRPKTNRGQSGHGEKLTRVTDLHNNMYSKRLALAHLHAKLRSIHDECYTNALVHKLTHTYSLLSSNNGEEDIFALGHELTHSHTADKKVHKNM